VGGICVGAYQRRGQRSLLSTNSLTISAYRRPPDFADLGGEACRTSQFSARSQSHGSYPAAIPLNLPIIQHNQYDAADRCDWLKRGRPVRWPLPSVFSAVRGSGCVVRRKHRRCSIAPLSGNSSSVREAGHNITWRRHTLKCPGIGGLMHNRGDARRSG
jgi:hypothetical protein